MGLLKRVFRPVRKIAKKIIPKEIRPFLPYIAAGIPGAQGLASLSFMNPAAQKALFAGLTSAATDEDGNPLRAAALAAAPDVLSSGLGTVAQKYGAAGDTADVITFTERVADIAGKTKQGIEGAGALKTIGAQTAIDQSAKLAEINQDEIDKYNEELRKQGVLDKTKRRTSILNIYLNAGYEPDYVNSMLDRYGYDEGGRIGFAEGLGIFDEDMLENISRGYKGSKEAMAKMNRLRKRKPKDDKTMIPPKKPKDPEDKDEEEPVLVKDVDKDLAGGLMAAARGVEQAFGRPFGNIEPVPMLRFARGGEVEIEEETEDLGIRDFMRDQGVEYGEQVSNTQNDRILEMLFEKYLEMGLSPKDAAEAAQNEFDRMSQKPDEGIMQMASGYKTDIEEMYEQYVFEMEEQGLQPMSFAEFLAQARAGMADGGEVSIGQIEMLIKRGADNDLIKEITGAADGVIDQIRDAMERKKFNLETMSKADGGIANLAAGGSAGSRYSFLINKQKQGILTPDEEKELLQLEMMFADESQGMKDGGIMSPEEYFKAKRKYQNKKDKERMRREYEEYRYRMKSGPRDEAKDGGIMEKDMRGGGFIPEGTKERADDVPARLSKNEFVMTADAVRAAGGGSINKGAKRMYDMMYSLEGKV